MKKYIKPSIEYIDLTGLGRLMSGGLEGSAGSGIGGTPDPSQGGQGLAPRRRVF